MTDRRTIDQLRSQRRTIESIPDFPDRDEQLDMIDSALAALEENA